MRRQDGSPAGPLLWWEREDGRSISEGSVTGPIVTPSSGMEPCRSSLRPVGILLPDMEDQSAGRPVRKWLHEGVNTTDPIVIILKSHLWMEFFLGRCIEERMESPDALALSRLTFPHRVELAVGLGAVHESLKGSLMKVNTMRNRFVHDPLIVYDEAMARELISTFPKELKMLTEPSPDDDDLDVLRRPLAVLLAQLERYLDATRDRKALERAVAEAVEMNREHRQGYDPTVHKWIEERVRVDQAKRRERKDAEVSPD
jgi:hypothetical protein